MGKSSKKGTNARRPNKKKASAKKATRPAEEEAHAQKANRRYPLYKNCRIILDSNWEREFPDLRRNDVIACSMPIICVQGYPDCDKDDEIIDSLRKHFTDCGEIVCIHVKRPERKAFIRFKYTDAVIKALESQRFIDGYEIVVYGTHNHFHDVNDDHNCKLALKLITYNHLGGKNEAVENRMKAGGNDPALAWYIKPVNFPFINDVKAIGHSAILYVTGFPTASYYFDEMIKEGLFRHFKICGNILKISIHHQSGGQLRPGIGYAYLYFEESESITMALQLHKSNLHFKTLGKFKIDVFGTNAHIFEPEKGLEHDWRQATSLLVNNQHFGFFEKNLLCQPKLANCTKVLSADWFARRPYLTLEEARGQCKKVQVVFDYNFEENEEDRRREHLMETFKTCGEIEGIILKPGQTSDVLFKDDASVGEALKLNGKFLRFNNQSRMVNVCLTHSHKYEPKHGYPHVCDYSIDVKGYIMPLDQEWIARNPNKCSKAERGDSKVIYVSGFSKRESLEVRDELEKMFTPCGEIADRIYIMHPEAWSVEVHFKDAENAISAQRFVSSFKFKLALLKLHLNVDWSSSKSIESSILFNTILRVKGLRFDPQLSSQEIQDGLGVIFGGLGYELEKKIFVYEFKDTDEVDVRFAHVHFKDAESIDAALELHCKDEIWVVYDTKVF